jgi:hypothetical protein
MDRLLGNLIKAMVLILGERSTLVPSGQHDVFNLFLIVLSFLNWQILIFTVKEYITLTEISEQILEFFPHYAKQIENQTLFVYCR